MINPTQFNSYAEYERACQTENELPVDRAIWTLWKYPAKPLVEPSLEDRVTELERRMNELEAGK